MGICSSKTSQSSADASGHVSGHKMLAPMWVVKLSDVLEMEGAPLMHQDLMKRGLLVERQADFLVIFVSHQWLGRHHPDRFGEQLRVLQTVLRNILSGKMKVENDLMSQMVGDFRKLSPQEQASIKDAYIWMDWFSVPQGVFAESLHSAPLLVEDASRALDCINSIPYYVDCCEIFLALVPSLQHNDTGVECNYRSWLRRGWCRTEMWCKLLSDSKTPIVTVTSETSAAFISPHRWVHFPVPLGEFTVEEDRVACSQVIHSALALKIQTLKKEKKKREVYRFFVARLECWCGLPFAARSVESFLEDFQFESTNAAIKQKQGMGAIACAVASFDLGMMKTFAKFGAPVNTRFPDIPEIDLFAGFSPMEVAAMGGWYSEAPVEELLKLRGDVNSCCDMGPSAVTGCVTARLVEIMVEYRADVNLARGPMKLSPLAVMVGRGQAPPSAIQRLLELRANPNPKNSPFGTMATFYAGNLYAPEVALLLVNARADVNQVNHPSTLFAAVSKFSRAYCCVAKDPPWVIEYFANCIVGSTPLTAAVVCGEPELVEFLLAQRAEVKNSRGKSIFDLARTLEMRSFIESLTAGDHKTVASQGQMLQIFRSETVEVAL